MWIALLCGGVAGPHWISRTLFTISFSREYRLPRGKEGEVAHISFIFLLFAFLLHSADPTSAPHASDHIIIIP